MNIIFIIGSILIFILLFAVVTTVISDAATAKRYRKKLADYDLRSKMQEQMQEGAVKSRQMINEKVSAERQKVFSTPVGIPAA